MQGERERWFHSWHTHTHTTMGYIYQTCHPKQKQNKKPQRHGFNGGTIAKDSCSPFPFCVFFFFFFLHQKMLCGGPCLVLLHKKKKNLAALSLYIAVYFFKSHPPEGKKTNTTTNKQTINCVVCVYQPHPLLQHQISIKTTMNSWFWHVCWRMRGLHWHCHYHSYYYCCYYH